MPPPEGVSAKGDDGPPQKQRARAEDPTEAELSALRRVDQPTQLPFVPPPHQGKRYGRGNFDNQIFETCKSLLEEEVTMQDTEALVLDAASGTGKTFSVLSFPTAANSSTAVENTKFVLAYIGFNIQWRLTDRETLDLNTAKIQNDEIATRNAVESVILPRLLGVLQQLINQHDVLDHHVQPDGAFPLVHFNAPCGELRNSALRQVVIEKAKELHRCFPGKNLVVVTNLDEAQFLHREGGQEGARAGLRLLRELQYNILQASCRESGKDEPQDELKCLLLPIATGVNPYTLLNFNSEGRNTPICTTLLTLEEFTQLAEARYKDNQGMLVKLFAAATYPRVRDMMKTPRMKEIEARDIDAKLAGKLMACAHSRQTTARENIPAHIYAVGSLKLAVPILDLAVWPSLMDTFGISALPYFPTMNFLSGGDAHRGFAEFESGAFRVIGFTLGLLNNQSENLGAFKMAFVDNTQFSDAWGTESTTNSISAILPEGPRFCHPFLYHKKPEQAAKGMFSPGFLRLLKCLEEVRSPTDTFNSMFMLTGGRAPFDFIKVRMVNRSTKTIAIALGDAKHCSKPKEKTDSYIKHEALALGEKAVWWIAGIKRELRRLGYTVEEACPVSLITNVPTPNYKTVPVEYKKVADDGAETVSDVIVLSPSNFRFSPWTDLLFRSDFQRNDDDEIEDFRQPFSAALPF